MPIDHELEAPGVPNSSGGEQREIRERGRVDDVVAVSSPGEVGEHAQTEDKRWKDAPAGLSVELQTRTHNLHADAGQKRLLAAFPLTESQVRDLMPTGYQAFAEIPVPTFGSTNRVRIETVVDKANPHEREITMSNAGTEQLAIRELCDDAE